MTDPSSQATLTNPSTPPASPEKHTAARSRVPKWLRIFLPALLILVWLTAAGIGGPYFGKVSEVASNDQTSYLPESADATQVQALLSEFNDSDAIPAIVVFVSDDALTDDELSVLSAELE